MLAAVLGQPISHSRSPLLHNAAYARLGIDAHYSAIEMDQAAISAFLRDAHSKTHGEQYSGFSLTMPLKEILRDDERISTLSKESGLDFQLDRDARAIGSINTLLRTDGGFRALSTDFLAFRRLLGEVATHNSSITILGGGGTARAAIGALESFGLHEIIVHLRGASDSPHACVLRQCFPNIDFTFLEFGSPLTANGLLLNATPRGAADSYAQDVKLAEQSLFFESLYHPWPTALAAASLELGLPLYSGNQLLVEQALDQISLMTGQDFNYDEMRGFLLSL